MAKRAELDPKESAGLFSKTESEQPQDDRSDPIVASGIGLRESEWVKIDEISSAMGIKKHAVTVYAVRYFLKDWEAGKIKTETRQSLPGLD